MVFVATSCRDSATPFFTSQRGSVVALVGEKRLYSEDVARSLPANVVGSDSVAFVELYVDRWVKHQIKVDEAERIFSSSSTQIDKMVEEYRNTLLSQRLDQLYLNTIGSAPFTHEDIEEYYRHSGSHFKLTTPIVKGVILRIPADHNYRTTIATMMKSRSAETRENLISMCDKSQDMLFEEFTSEWIDYSSFIARMPVVQGDSEVYMSRRGVQSLRDDTHIYLFEIVDCRKVGQTKPLERAEEQIRKLLTKQFHNRVIREREEERYDRVMSSDKVKIYR